VPLLGTNFIETPEISGVRSIVHSALFLTFFYLGFIRKWKCHSITTYDQDNEKIREVVTTWMRATAEGDLETVLSLIAEDAVFLLPDQPPMQGREAFAAALRSAPGQVRIEGKPTMSFFPSSSGPGATSPVVIRTRAMRWPASLLKWDLLKTTKSWFLASYEGFRKKGSA
jgi:SnoaL-like domain